MASLKEFLFERDMLEVFIINLLENRLINKHWPKWEVQVSREGNKAAIAKAFPWITAYSSRPDKWNRIDSDWRNYIKKHPDIEIDFDFYLSKKLNKFKPEYHKGGGNYCFKKEDLKLAATLVELKCMLTKQEKRKISRIKHMITSINSNYYHISMALITGLNNMWKTKRRKKW